MHSVVATGEHFSAGDATAYATTSAFSPSAHPSALLRFAPGEEFTEREWPGGTLAETCTDGSMLAEVPFAGTGWIARHVTARLGRVEVLEPESVRNAVATFARDEVGRLGT
jgi:predicted DNA-binding transcriptional regulator YafY